MDRRVKRTKDNIAKAFWRAAEHKAVSQITVSEICTEANINRSTFYHYYTDIPELFEELKHGFSRQTEKFILELEEVKQSDVVMNAMLQYVNDNASVLRALKSNEQCTVFLNKLYEIIEAFFNRKLRQNYEIPETFPKARLKFMIRFITAGCYDVYLQFLNNTCELDIMTAAEYIISISDVCFGSYFQEQSEQKAEK